MNGIELYKDYLKRGNEITTWNKIITLGEMVNDKPFYDDFVLVLKTMMNRVVHNFGVIKTVLERSDYLFENLGNINLDYKVFEENRFDILNVPAILENHFARYGEIPYSVSFFFNYVKNIDLRGRFLNWENPYLLDAIYLYPIEGLIEINETPMNVQQDSGNYNYVFISPDEFIKEDISGNGSEYAIRLSNGRKLPDSHLLNFPGEITFIEYLRLGFKWAGLVGLEWYQKDEIPVSVMDVMYSIRRQMQPI